MIDPFANLSAEHKARLLIREHKKRAEGNWGHWDGVDLPNGLVAAFGGLYEITLAYQNDVFSVLQRSLEGGTHLGIASLSGIRPTWYEMMRIKDELLGEEVTAVEIYPPRSEVVDSANMYHLWTLPFEIPYSLAKPTPLGEDYDRA